MNIIKLQEECRIKCQIKGAGTKFSFKTKEGKVGEDGFDFEIVE